MKATQKFTPEYLQNCQNMSPQEIANFLDQFRQISQQATQSKTKSKLISIKIPEDLLEAFKTKAEMEGLRYQTQVKQLMKDWLAN